MQNTDTKWYFKSPDIYINKFHLKSTVSIQHNLIELHPSHYCHTFTYTPFHAGIQVR